MSIVHPFDGTLWATEMTLPQGSCVSPAFLISECICMGIFTDICSCQQVPVTNLMMGSNAFVAVNFSGSLGLTSGMFRGLHNHLFYGTLLQVYWLTGIYSSNFVLFPTEPSSSNVSSAEVLKRQVGQKLWKYINSFFYSLYLLRNLDSLENKEERQTNHLWPRKRTYGD